MLLSIVSHYNQLLRNDHEITKPTAAIESLIALLSASPPSTVSETLALIESSTAVLKASVPNSIALSAGTDLFQRYIITTLQSGSSRPKGKSKSSPASNSVDDFGAIRSHLLANSKVFVQRAKEARSSIARIAKCLVQDGSTVLTCGYSRVVDAVLTAAALDGVSFRVIYTQSFDPRSGTSDRTPSQIAAFYKKNIPTAIIPFAALATAASNASFCIVGAESVVENGGIISSMGTQQLGLLAQSMGKPMYVVAESHKFVRVYPLRAEELGLGEDVLDFRTDEERPDQSEGKNTKHAANVGSELDFTPPELITSLVTETGLHTPSAVSEELIKLWY